MNNFEEEERLLLKNRRVELGDELFCIYFEGYLKGKDSVIREWNNCMGGLW